MDHVFELLFFIMSSERVADRIQFNLQRNTNEHRTMYEVKFNATLPAI